MKFEDAMQSEFSAVSGGFPKFKLVDVFKLGQKVADRIEEAAKRSGLAGVSKDEFLKVVSKMYDDYIAKIDLPGPFDVTVHMMIKVLVMKMSEGIYDRLKPTTTTA